MIAFHNIYLSVAQKEFGVWFYYAYVFLNVSIANNMFCEHNKV